VLGHKQALQIEFSPTLTNIFASVDLLVHFPFLEHAQVPFIAEGSTPLRHSEVSLDSGSCEHQVLCLGLRLHGEDNFTVHSSPIGSGSNRTISFWFRLARLAEQTIFSYSSILRVYVNQDGQLTVSLMGEPTTLQQLDTAHTFFIAICWGAAMVPELWLARVKFLPLTHPFMQTNSFENPRKDVIVQRFGLQTRSGSQSAALCNQEGSSWAVFFGKPLGSYELGINGHIGSFSIFQRILDPSEIAHLAYTHHTLSALEAGRYFSLPFAQKAILVCITRQKKDDHMSTFIKSLVG